MDTGAWVGVVAGILSIIGSLVVAIRWLVKYYLHELVPNSGSSLKDKINRLETRIDEIYTILIERN